MTAPSTPPGLDDCEFCDMYRKLGSDFCFVCGKFLTIPEEPADSYPSPEDEDWISREMFKAEEAAPQ